jgi:hypothetical protein
MAIFSTMLQQWVEDTLKMSLEIKNLSKQKRGLKLREKGIYFLTLRKQGEIYSLLQGTKLDF